MGGGALGGRCEHLLHVGNMNSHVQTGSVFFSKFGHSDISGLSFSTLPTLHKEVNLCTFPVKLGRPSELLLRREHNENNAA